MIATSLESARIFIVDDQTPNVRLLEQLLWRSGFRNTRSFADGESMLEALVADEPDLILLDLHMPPPDGFAVLEALRARSAADDYLPVLVLTADAERPSRSRALAGGANDFLIKPFDAEEVLLRVRNLVETRRLHRALRTRNATLVAEVAARTTDLQESEARWAGVIASLSRLTALATPEATAESICDSLAALPDLAFVAVLAFGAGGTTFALAGRPSVNTPFRPNQALPPEWSNLIRSRVADGTWFGPWSAFGAGQSVPQPFDRDITAVALIPLRTASRLLGTGAAAATGVSGMTQLGRRLPALEAFAALASALLAPGILDRQRDDRVRDRIERIIAASEFRPVFQPILSVDSGLVVGHEALTRFDDGTRPDRCFADAAAVGLGLDLEVACLTAAIEARRKLNSKTWLSLNVSPALILERARLAAILSDPPAPIVLEITEHVPIDDYAGVREAIRSLGPNVRSAIDDAGAGFSSFRHIIELRPEFVKVDIGLVRAIERDPARQALVAGMVYFAIKTGCVLIAEGIETAAEHDTLRSLAVPLGQGFLLGMPGTLDATAQPAHVRVARRSGPDVPVAAGFRKPSRPTAAKRAGGAGRPRRS
jgi:EAL domain-containing protein (putative c-di-GMP-specific phosphodiesterase class I)/DNA-binding response OmpR family regulator